MSSSRDYDFTASNGLEARNILDAAKELLDAHMKLIAPSASFIRTDLLEQTPLRLTLSLDLTDANEVATLNQSIRDNGTR